MGRRGMGLAALAATVGVLAIAPSAQAAPSWSDGLIQKSQITNCASIIFGSPMQEDGAWTWTGQYLDSANPPDTSTTFYVHVVAGATGNSCSGQRVHFELLGTPAGVINVDAGSPIICWAINWNTNPPSAINEPTYPAGACPTGPEGGGIAGGLSFDAQTSPTNADPWPLPQGRGWEIQIPVQSPTPRMGGFGACNDCNKFDTYLLDGNSSPQLFPTQGLFVNNTTPGGGSTTNPGLGGTAGNGAGFKPNAQPTAPAAPVTTSAATPKKCKKGFKLKKGKCRKKKKKKK
jgi:hypothetical protein